MEEKLTDEKKEIVNARGKKILIGVVIIFIMILIVSFIVDSARNNKIKNAGWKIVSDSHYTRNGERCIGYRVYLPDDLWSDEDIRTVYHFVTDDDYYMHTVWFYRSEHTAKGSNSADAIMEETSPGLLPKIQR